jgi:hypothetical protein
VLDARIGHFSKEQLHVLSKAWGRVADGLVVVVVVAAAAAAAQEFALGFSFESFEDCLLQ